MIPVRATVIQKPDPFDRVKEAIDWAALKGIRVDVGTRSDSGFGVRCGGL